MNYIAYANSTNGTLTFADVSPPPDMIATLGLEIGGALCLLWAIRKVIKLLNKS